MQYQFRGRNNVEIDMMQCKIDSTEEPGAGGEAGGGT
jgi:hypothetical protein